MNRAEGAVRALSAEEAIELIGLHLEERANGGPDTREGDVALARMFGLDLAQIEEGHREAEAKARARIEAVAAKGAEIAAKLDAKAKAEAEFGAAFRAKLVARLAGAEKKAKSNLGPQIDAALRVSGEWDRDFARKLAGAIAEQSADVVRKEEPNAVVRIALEPEPEDEDKDEDEVTAAEDPGGASSAELILPAGTAAANVVALLNQKHAVIGNYGSKCAVLSWERWGVDHKVMMPTFQSFTDFRNRYMNRYVEKETEDGVKKIPAGKYWLGSPGRLSYEGVAFEPGEPEVLRGNRLNLYRGSAVTARKGSWKRLRSHIYRVLANGDYQSARSIVRWLAWTLQVFQRAKRRARRWRGRSDVVGSAPARSRRMASKTDL